MAETNKKIDPKTLNNFDGNLKTLERVCSASFTLLKKRDLAVIAINSGAEFINEKKLLIKYFGEKIAVDVDSERVYYLERQKNSKDPDSLTPVDIFSSSIILHYLNNADGTNLSGKWIAYRELPDGMFYFRTITGVLESLVKKYGNSSGDLIKVVEKNRGRRSPDFVNGAIIYPFPYFPILIILEEKSEEFEAAVRVLFDSNSCHYIKTDIIKMILVYMARLLTS